MSEPSIITPFGKPQPAGQIEIMNVGLDGLVKLFTETIRKELKSDACVLQALDITVWRPETVEQAMALERLGKQFLFVEGALGFNEDKVGWRLFGFHMEEGLTAREDREVAKNLAKQCRKCVEEMKRERKSGKHVLVA